MEMRLNKNQDEGIDMSDQAPAIRCASTRA